MPHTSHASYPSATPIPFHRPVGCFAFLSLPCAPCPVCCFAFCSLPYLPVCCLSPPCLLQAICRACSCHLRHMCCRLAIPGLCSHPFREKLSSPLYAPNVGTVCGTEHFYKRGWPVCCMTAFFLGLPFFVSGNRKPMLEEHQAPSLHSACTSWKKFWLQLRLIRVISVLSVGP